MIARRTITTSSQVLHRTTISSIVLWDIQILVACSLVLNWSPLLNNRNICYAQLRLSCDPQEFSSVDSHASFFGSLWGHEHMPCMCPLVLLLFCLCVHCTPCLVLNLPFHNFKIPLLKTGYITGNYLILQKLPVYHLNHENWLLLDQFSFKYHISFLNDNLDYTPPDNKLVTLFGTLIRAMSRSPWEIKLSIPVDDGGAGGFKYTLEVTNVFDDIITKNKTCVFFTDQLCSTYQNHVLHNADCRTQAMEEMEDTKSDNETYKPDAFQKIHNTFFNHVASTGCPVSTGNCLFHYICSGKKNLRTWPLNPFTPTSRKHCMLSNSWVFIMKKNSMTTKPVSSSFIHSQGTHPGLCVPRQMWFWHRHPWRSQEFFHGHYDINLPKKNDCTNDLHNNKNPSSWRNHGAFMPCDNTKDAANPVSSSHTNDQPCDWSCSNQCPDTSLPGASNQCGFYKDRTIEWTDCTMHDPATGSQITKDFEALCKSAQPSKPCDPHLSTWHPKSTQPSKPCDLHLSTQCPTLPPHCNCDSHSSYHFNKHQRPTKWNCSCSRSCSCSCSSDHHDDDHCSQHSSHPCHDTYIGHHDVHPSDKPYLDIFNHQPIGFASIASHVSSHSSNIVFDSDLYNIEYVKKFVTYPDCDDNNSHSHISKIPSKPDNTFCMGTFDIHNYTDSKTK